MTIEYVEKIKQNLIGCIKQIMEEEKEKVEEYIPQLDECFNDVIDCDDFEIASTSKELKEMLEDYRENICKRLDNFDLEKSRDFPDVMRQVYDKFRERGVEWKKK